jgi:hypothetical protein
MGTLKPTTVEVVVLLVIFYITQLLVGRTVLDY